MCSIVALLAGMDCSFPKTKHIFVQALDIDINRGVLFTPFLLAHLG